jgi:glycosyltransferase involved in cell wall biosynthesis
MNTPAEWHILTGEYPPDEGGVSDYTRQVARGLSAAGDPVHVWAPPNHSAQTAASEISKTAPDGRVIVHRLPDRFGPRGLRTLTREFDARTVPRRLLVQYVPHAFGWKAANVPFCLWLRARRRDPVWVMFHEVAFPFDRDETLSRNALAAVNRIMAMLVGGAASRAFVSIPGWTPRVRAVVRPGTAIDWLPVPSAIPLVNDLVATAHIRSRYAPTSPLIGHFGTYGDAIRALLDPALRALVGASPARVLLLGRKSDRIAREIIERRPELRDRVHGTGALKPDEVSRHVSACDVMLQPYPDGVSTRRTSAMVSLLHGRPIVTTSGWLTEPLWRDSGAAVLLPPDDPAALGAAAASLVADEATRQTFSAHARALYDARFHVRHTIDALRSACSASANDSSHDRSVRVSLEPAV